MALRHHLFDTDESALPQIRAWLRTSIGPIAQRLEGYEFIQAVDELCSNIVEHADERPEVFMGTLSIQLQSDKEELVAAITYKGDEFDLTKYKPRSIEEIMNRGHKGGIGIRLISSLSSEVNYRRENGLNVCTIAKRIA